jgi:hypothetical protein
MAEDQKQYDATEDELGDLLHRLIVVEGQAEVEIQHPTEGMMLVTQESYHKLMADLDRVKGMSPAQRIEEGQKIANKRLIQFKTGLIDAKFFVVDIEDDENFGKDIHGTEIPLEGMQFVPIHDYPKGIEPIDYELGCFVEERMTKPPIRILSE